MGGSRIITNVENQSLRMINFNNKPFANRQVKEFSDLDKIKPISLSDLKNFAEFRKNSLNIFCSNLDQANILVEQSPFHKLLTKDMCNYHYTNEYIHKFINTTLQGEFYLYFTGLRNSLLYNHVMYSIGNQTVPYNENLRGKVCNLVLKLRDGTESIIEGGQHFNFEVKYNLINGIYNNYILTYNDCKEFTLFDQVKILSIEHYESIKNLYPNPSEAIFLKNISPNIIEFMDKFY